jgi:ELWxxDGT repeat protein
VRDLVVAGDELYFGATLGDSGELWKSDGTTAGTVKVADTGERAYRITGFGAGVVFAVSGAVLNGEMWASDGTTAGTAPLGGAGGPFEITVAGDYAYWNGGYKQLWRTDGTPGGTQRVSNDLRAGETAEIIDGLTAVGDTLFYNVDYGQGSSGQRYELRRVSGSSPAVLVRDFDSGTGGNLTQSTLASGGFLYFIPKPVPGNRYPGYALWRSDGTTAGTVKIASGRFDFLAEAANHVFVTSYDIDQGQWSLNEVESGGVAASSAAGPFAFPFGDASYVAPALTVAGATTYFLADGGLWKIGDDLTDPDTAITGGFAQDQVVTSYDFPERTFTAAAFDDFTPTDGASYEWRVDSGPWEVFGKEFGFPVRINGQPNEGVHTVSVRVIDAAGRTDPTPASRSFTIDLVATPPTTPSPAGPSAACTSATTALAQATATVAKATKAVTNAMKKVKALKKAGANPAKVKAAMTKVKKAKKALKSAQQSQSAAEDSQAQSC